MIFNMQHIIIELAIRKNIKYSETFVAIGLDGSSCRRFYFPDTNAAMIVPLRSCCHVFLNCMKQCHGHEHKIYFLERTVLHEFLDDYHCGKDHG
jgi:hypothetical protein